MTTMFEAAVLVYPGYGNTVAMGYPAAAAYYPPVYAYRPMYSPYAAAAYYPMVAGYYSRKQPATKLWHQKENVAPQIPEDSLPQEHDGTRRKKKRSLNLFTAMGIWKPTGKLNDYTKCTSKKYETPWTSIYIASAIAFLQSFQYSMFSATLWSYTLSVNGNVTQSIFGLIVGANSFMQAIAAPVFGYWSTRIENVKLPLFTGLLFMVAGNILYFIMPLLPAGSAFTLLIVARMLTGVGAGNSALIRAYASQASSSADRSKAIAWTTAGDTLGTTTGPLIQMACLGLGPVGISFLGLRFTTYTMPAFVALLIDLLGLLVVSRFFVEDYTMLRLEQKEYQDCDMTPCWIAVAICVITRYSQSLLLSTFDGVGSSYTTMMFGFDVVETDRYNSLSLAIQALVGFLVYLSFIYFNCGKQLPMRASIFTAILAFMTYHAVTFSYPFYSDHVIVSNNASSTGHEFGVCEGTKYDWCESLTTYHPLVFYVAYLGLVGGFFPVINIALTTLFSKVIGPRAQGTLQGVFQVAGCISKMSSPGILGSVFTFGGPRAVWILQESQLFIVLLLWIIFRRKMIGLTERLEQEDMCKRSIGSDSDSEQTKGPFEIVVWVTRNSYKA
ncbi:unnamed protein product, partial [Mesorhabditis spiculigera]